MIQVGVAGIGFMGWIHYLAYQRCNDISIKAICTRDDKKRSGDWTGIQGNFGPPGEQVDVSGWSTYSELDEMLRDPDLDLIDICLPPAMHADATCRALEHGKHVLCEKPMALTTAECDRMVAAAKANQRQLFIAHVLPMFPEYAQALEWIRSGQFGDLRGGSFKRIISDPSWLKDFYDPTKVGGPLIDLHVHDAHWIRMLFGMPAMVQSAGRMRGEVVEFCHSLFQYPENHAVVHAVSGIIPQQGRPFTHGFEIHLEQATLLFESAFIGGENEVLMPLTALVSDGSVERPQLGSGDPVDAFVGEIEEVVQCLRSNKPSTILGADLARDALRLCDFQTESVRTGQPVQVS